MPARRPGITKDSISAPLPPPSLVFDTSDLEFTGTFDSVDAEIATPLITNGRSQFETSYPGPRGSATTSGPYTQNAASVMANNNDEDKLSDSLPYARKTLGGQLLDSKESARHFNKSRSVMLSTHSTIVYEAGGLHHKCNNLQTLMNLIKGTAGTGILSLPRAFLQSGLWVGLFGFLVIATIAVHCQHLLVKCAGILEKRSKIDIQNYAQAMELCLTYGPSSLQKFGKFFKHVINWLIYVMQCGFCTVYIVWVAVNIKDVVDQFWPSSPDVRVYELMVFLLLLPYIMVKSLRTLAIFSAFANLIYLVGLVIILQYLVQGLPNVSDRPAFNSWATLPMFFGTAVFSYESICLVLPLRSKVLHQEDFGGWTGVLNLGMVTITSVYSAVGFYGYLKFGELTAPTITLNLPDDDWLYLSVNLMFAVALFISVAVQFYVPISVIWPSVENMIQGTHSSRTIKLAELATRAGLLTLIFVIALIVPHVDLLMSLVGSLFGSLLAIIFPAIIELITLYEERELNAIIIIKDVILILVGIVGFLSGTYTSLVDIVETF